MDDLITLSRVHICEAFIIIAKNKGLRKIFFRRDFLNSLKTISLRLITEQNNARPSQLLDVSCATVKLLSMICTVQKNQFYIPGETNLSERLRKRSFDSGTFTFLQYLHNSLQHTQKEPYVEIRNMIQEHVLKHVDLTDLSYHKKVLDQMQKSLDNEKER